MLSPKPDPTGVLSQLHNAPSPARRHFRILTLALGVTMPVWIGLYWYFGLVADEFLGGKVEQLLKANGVPERDVAPECVFEKTTRPCIARQMNITLTNRHSFNAIYHGLVLISVEEGAPFRHERLPRRGMTVRIDNKNGLETIRLRLTYQ